MLRTKKHPEATTQAGLIEESKVVNNNMTEEAELFPNPNPPLAEFVADIAIAEAKQEEADILEAQLKVKQKEKADAFKKCDTNYSMLANYVQNIANGDLSIILKAGMHAVSSNHVVRDMTQVQNFRFGKIDNPQSASFIWDKVKGAKTYVVRISTDILNSESWEITKLCTKCSTTLENLPSGEKLWFKVSAVGADGEGRASEPISKIIT